MKTYSLSDAKQSLGKLADDALNGEEILIIRKSKLLIMKPVDIEIKTPVRPHGYFDDCFDLHEEKISRSISKRGPKSIVL